MRFAYYPGCTATSTSIEYDESVRETSRYLGIDLEEIPDWTCCGATSGHIIDPGNGISPAQQKSGAGEQMCLAIVSPCPACSLRHKIAEHELNKDPELKAKIEKDIGVNLDLTEKTKHFLEVLFREVGIAAIKEKFRNR